MKRLYVVKDIPKDQEDCSSYCYVVKAETKNEAINIVKQKTGHSWDWEANLTDNTEVWEWNRTKNSKNVCLFHLCVYSRLYTIIHWHKGMLCDITDVVARIYLEYVWKFILGIFKHVLDIFGYILAKGL